MRHYMLLCFLPSIWVCLRAMPRVCFHTCIYHASRWELPQCLYVLVLSDACVILCSIHHHAKEKTKKQPLEMREETSTQNVLLSHARVRRLYGLSAPKNKNEKTRDHNVIEMHTASSTDKSTSTAASAYAEKSTKQTTSTRVCIYIHARANHAPQCLWELL